MSIRSKFCDFDKETRKYMNSIYKQATLCKKTTAYAITKSIDNNAEIKDFFEEAR